MPGFVFYHFKSFLISDKAFRYIELDNAYLIVSTILI